MPFPILGVDCDNGSEFINEDLLAWCQDRRITFTRSRPGNKNDGCHVEQKNWAVVRTVVGYYRYDTASELLLLNEIWRLQSMLTNYFHPQQKLISKVRTGAKVSRKHDTATTPFRRAIDHPSMTVERIVSAQADPLADQSGRHPTPDSGVDRPALHPGHQQADPAPPLQSPNAHTHVRQRTPQSAHLDVRQPADKNSPRD